MDYVRENLVCLIDVYFLYAYSRKEGTFSEKLFFCLLERNLFHGWEFFNYFSFGDPLN